MSQQIKDSKKYVNDKRQLNMAGLRHRFENHLKLRDDEVDRLFEKEIKKYKLKLTPEQRRWLSKGYRKVLVFDIESINFDARMGFIICWYGIKWDLLTDKTTMIYDRLEPQDMKSNYHKQSFNFDERLLNSLSAAIKDCDILAGHYISKFDLPYFSARCHLTKQDDLVPKYMECRVVDTWKITKQKYNMYNSGGNSLRNAGKVIAGYDDKTSVDLEIWKTIYYVEHPKWKKNRKYICDHCEIDVQQNLDVLKKEMLRVNVGGSSI